MVEHRPVKAIVAGSSPASGAKVLMFKRPERVFLFIKSKTCL